MAYAVQAIYILEIISVLFRILSRCRMNSIAFFFIADYHSLTTHPNPADFHKNVRQVLVEYLACGIDPDKCTLFVQSDLPETAELYLLLNMNAYVGELERCTSFKDKIRQQPDNINAGLLTYPTLMAADILIHRAVKVPVGKDQEQHLEMARQFANRFNRIYQTELFPEPFAFNYGINQQTKVQQAAVEQNILNLIGSA